MEFEIEGVDAKTAAKFATEISLNPDDTEAYRLANLRACPDHYLLKCTKPKCLEIYETTGCMAGPGHFLIEYDVETDLVSKRNPDMPYESVGIATTLDGKKTIGGVRHQFGDTEYGCKARLCVEFPGKCPDTMIAQHQKHMAMEFDYWIRYTKSLISE